MLTRKNKVIGVHKIEHDELIKMIENMDGVKVRRTPTGIQISICKHALSKAPVGIPVKKKNRKGKRIEHLTPIYGECKKKKEELEFIQSSAIIAKPY